MAVGSGAILAGAGIGLVSNIIAGDKAAKAAAEARAAAGDAQAQAMLQMAEAVKELEAVGIPSIEAQKLVLEKPELVGLQEVHQIATSYDDISSDPRLKDAQMKALGAIEKMGGAGLTEAEKAQALLMQREAAGEEQARQKSILRSMAEQGRSGEGAELAARLSSSQGAAERRAMAQAQLAGQAQKRALEAMMQSGQLAGGIRSQDFGEQSQIASAKDAIARFNAQNRMNIEGRNLAERQRVADEGTRLANLQQQYNKELLSRRYQQEMDKAKSIASARTNTAQAQQSQAQNHLNAGASKAQGILQQGAAIGNLAGAAAGALAKYGSGSEGGSQKVTKFDYSGTDPSTNPGAYGDPTKMVAQDGGVAMNNNPQAMQKQIHPMTPQPSTQNANGGFAGGGVAIVEADMEDRIIPGNDFSGDRVDAKINSGEMVLNVEQQQRLMDLLKGYRSIQGLGDENIVEQPPIDNPEIELPEDLPSTPPPTAMADGGIADDDLYKRLGQTHQNMVRDEEYLKEAQKSTRAKIKALETLMGNK